MPTVCRGLGRDWHRNQLRGDAALSTEPAPKVNDRKVAVIFEYGHRLVSADKLGAALENMLDRCTDRLERLLRLDRADVTLLGGLKEMDHEARGVSHCAVGISEHGANVMSDRSNGLSRKLMHNFSIRAHSMGAPFGLQDVGVSEGGRLRP